MVYLAGGGGGERERADSAVICTCVDLLMYDKRYDTRLDRNEETDAVRVNGTEFHRRDG